jgi:ELWxxDGT repeat protein
MRMTPPRFSPLRSVLAAALLACVSARGDTVELALDLNPGPRGSGPSYLVAYKGEIYFRSNSALQNVELWRFDGTTAAQVGEINPTGSSDPTDLTVANDTLYFGANDGTGQRLWSWDGTTLSKVAGAVSVQNPEEFIAFKGDLYFRGTRFSDVGTELFRWNGTTLTVIDIYSGTGSGYPQHFAEYNGALYFSANGQPGEGSELWRYDGTALSKAGENINPGNGSAPAWLTVFQGRLYFTAYNPAYGNELWSFDGAASTLVADQVPGAASFDPSGLTVFKHALYFAANDHSPAGNELWTFNGDIFSMVADINPNLASGGDDFLADSTPSNFAIHDHKLYFLANEGTHGQELWVYSGNGLPQMVADIDSGTSGSNASGLRAINGGLFLAADSGDGFGQELYRLVPDAVVDSDEDGMPDDWEIEHGLNLDMDDTADDLDGDGVSNLAEFVAGTDPQSPPSAFQAELDGTFRLSWPSVPGKTYLVSANTGSGWEPFQTVSAAPAPADHTVLKLTPPTSGLLLFRVGVSAE